MSNDLARDFLQSVSGFTLDEGAPKSSADRPVRLATVHASYIGTGPARVTFDGESTATIKAYVVMEPVAVADRVVLLPVGQGYVILGKLGGGAWPTADRGYKNHIINGRFRINQAGYASAASLALNAYCFDQWKATTASTTVTFTTAPQGQSVTINADKSIGQPIERANMPAATYVLSWTGTARGRVYNVGAAAPGYAASGSTWVVDGLADVLVEFTTPAGLTGTLGEVQLEVGTLATAFELLPFSVELANCQRYWESSYEYGTPIGTVTTAGVRDHYGVSDSALNVVAFIPFKVTKRVAPAVTAYSQTGVVDGWQYSRSGASGLSPVTTNYRLSTGSTHIYCSCGAAWTAVQINGHWVANARL